MAHKSVTLVLMKYRQNPVPSDPALLSPSGRSIGRFIGSYVKDKPETYFRDSLRLAVRTVNDQYIIRAQDYGELLAVYIQSTGQWRIFDDDDEYRVTKPREVCVFDENDLYTSRGDIRNISSLPRKLLLIPYPDRLDVYAVRR